MKRHASFIPLSREHHDGLLLATRLQQGDTALPRLWSHDPLWQARHVADFTRDRLRLHFRIEEEEIFAEVVKFGEEAQSVAQVLIADHQALEAMGEECARPDQARIPSILVAFGARLEEHIRIEERTLFPLCERLMPEELLETIGRRIIAHYAKASI